MNGIWLCNNKECEGYDYDDNKAYKKCPICGKLMTFYDYFVIKRLAHLGGYISTSMF